ncbi:unnamed protein product [Ceratitis capitata]|uniref:(Mediterranean fruit fly) hypothetical protein n=1 Tax=Ceratitis capitata TaxID=7213 RepID=A0A811UWY1_CERCA|nr:unnamed protein product [Ceratitis capitata]
MPPAFFQLYLASGLSQAPTITAAISPSEVAIMSFYADVATSHTSVIKSPHQLALSPNSHTSHSIINKSVFIILSQSLINPIGEIKGISAGRLQIPHTRSSSLPHSPIHATLLTLPLLYFKVLNNGKAQNNVRISAIFCALTVEGFSHEQLTSPEYLDEWAT